MNKLKGKITPTPTFKGNLTTAKVYPELEDLVVTPSQTEQSFKSDKYGYNNVRVRAVEGDSLTVEPSLEEQTFNGLYSDVKVNRIIGDTLEVTPSLEEQNFAGVYTSVKANPIEATEITIEPTTEAQTKEGLFNKVKVNATKGENLTVTPNFETQQYNGLYSNVQVNPIESEELNVTPSEEEQVKEGLYDKVTVGPIPSEYIIPSGSEEITANGAYDVTEIKNVNVNVPTPEPNLGTKTITANGDYNASEDNLDGYSNVSVNIPIPEPNVASKTITENGTYKASDEGLDGFSSVEVNVASSDGGSTGATEKDVNFYTPYGDLVIGYTIEEAHALTELPQAPELPRLTFQEWNYSLEEVQTTNTKLDIGANYTTTSGETEFDVSVNPQSSMTVSFYKLNGMTSVDWGDGTVDANTSHTYTVAGDYTIIVYGLTSLVTSLMNNGSTSTTAPKNYNLTEVRLSDKITAIPSYGLQYCQSLKYIVVSKNLKSYAAYCLRECRALKYFVFAKATTSLNFTYGLYYCVSLKGVSIPSHITSIGSNFLNYCSNLKRLILPKDMTTMSSSMYYIIGQCYALNEIVFTSALTSFGINLNSQLYNLEKVDFRNCTSVPTISTASYLNTTNYTCKFLVPKNLLEQWKSATTWSTYADRIIGV